MFVPFSSLPPTSRVWVFQADRPIDPQAMAAVQASLRHLTDNWMVHGAPLNSSFEVRYNRFIILAADDSAEAVSGCSIDSAVRGVKQVEQLAGVDLFDRSKVAFKINDEVRLYSLQELKQNFAEGTLNADVLTFDNLVGTKAMLEKEWLKPCRQTWVKRYIPGELV